MKSLEEINKLIEVGEYEVAKRYLQPHLKENNAEAMLIYSSFSLSNESIEDFEKRSLSLVQKSAELGNRDALYMMGVYYDTGEYFEKDTLTASLYFKKSAIAGHPRAKLSYGLDLFYGINGIKQNKDLGLQYILQASEAGVESATVTYKELAS